MKGFNFTGREWDPQTQLYYYRARWYGAGMGRFVSPDALGSAAQLEIQQIRDTLLMQNVPFGTSMPGSSLEVPVSASYLLADIRPVLVERGFGYADMSPISHNDPSGYEGNTLIKVVAVIGVTCGVITVYAVIKFGKVIAHFSHFDADPNCDIGECGKKKGK